VALETGVGVNDAPGVTVGSRGAGVRLGPGAAGGVPALNVDVAVLKVTTSDSLTISAWCSLLPVDSTKKKVATRYPAQLKMTNTAMASKPK
jgi:hypothetical protein